jgi:ribosome-associated protein
MKGKLNLHPPFHEFEFEATRSSGAGGQHVNKTDSAVLLRWNPRESQSFSEEQIEVICRFLQRQLTGSGDLLIRASEERSQKQNKDLCVKKWVQLISKALTPNRPRIKTKPTRTSQKRRINEKKSRAETKKLRGRVIEFD